MKHLVRILKVKRKLFSTDDKRRRIPYELQGGSTLDQGLLPWIFEWITRIETEARHATMEIYYALSGGRPLNDGKLSYNYPNLDLIGDAPFNEKITISSKLISHLESGKWFLDNGYKLPENTIIESVQTLFTNYDSLISNNGNLTITPTENRKAEKTTIAPYSFGPLNL